MNRKIVKFISMSLASITLCSFGGSSLAINDNVKDFVNYDSDENFNGSLNLVESGDNYKKYEYINKSGETETIKEISDGNNIFYEVVLPNGDFYTIKPDGFDSFSEDVVIERNGVKIDSDEIFTEVKSYDSEVNTINSPIVSRFSASDTGWVRSGTYSGSIKFDVLYFSVITTILASRFGANAATFATVANAIIAYKAKDYTYKGISYTRVANSSVATKHVIKYYRQWDGAYVSTSTHYKYY